MALSVTVMAKKDAVVNVPKVFELKPAYQSEPYQRSGRAARAAKCIRLCAIRYQERALWSDRVCSRFHPLDVSKQAVRHWL